MLSVLLADDIPANQRALRRILERRGHRVSVAQNGREAVELFKEHQFDVVLMDLQMPVMDGRQATTAIRQLEPLNHRPLPTPIIAMTAHALNEDREKCLQGGMDAYLVKPVDLDELVHMVESVAVGPTPRSPSEAVCSDAGRRPKPRVLDLEGALRRLAGDRELFAEFIHFYDEDCPALLESIREAIMAGRVEQLQRAAHNLKGLASNLGGEAVRSAAQELENLARSQDLSRAHDAMLALEHEMKILHTELEPLRT
jgi:CheY-like chemotaxis protein